MSTQADEKLPEDSLQNHWDLIDKSRKVMAKEISSLANSLSGPRVRQLKSVSLWLNSSQEYDAVLKRPDVLCFCQPWLEASLDKPNQEPLDQAEIARAIGVGFCKLENNSPMMRNLTPFLYPMLAALAWLVMITFGSIFVLPQFREMFEEFGIALPFWTQRVFDWGELLEAYWLPSFIVLLLVPILLVIFLYLSQRGHAYSLNWLDRRFAKFRTKLSIWASHVSSLLAAGVSDTDAIQIAGRCSASKELRARCDAFAQGGMEDLLNPARYPLINNSLTLENKAAKIAILEEAARYYRSLSGVVQGWWLAWLSKAILALIFLTLLFVVSALFMPMISIISGLTG